PAPHRLPALLPQTLSLTPSLGCSESRHNDDPSYQSSQGWSIAGDTPRLLFLRIDPVSRDIRTPSFLLPSAYGLVSFATPPPFCLV
ncbi:MAG: hypothetical protein LBC10_00320, partial [Deltaproteobacteria bacterium]|nr:hypothetical protein [Deltaproteobacteria bacterium]